MIVDKDIVKVGNSHFLLIDKQIMEYLDLKEGTPVKVEVRDKKYGPMLAVWNEKQQEKFKNDHENDKVNKLQEKIKRLQGEMREIKNKESGE